MHPAPNLTPVPFSDRRVPPEVGDRFIVAGFGVGVQGDRRTAGKLRTATLVATRPPELAAAQPDRSAKARRSRRSRRLQRRFGRSGARCAGPRPGRHRELVGTHRRRAGLRIRQRRRAARALPLLDHWKQQRNWDPRWSHDPHRRRLCARAVAVAPAAAMVGGAPPATEEQSRGVVMLTGSHGTFCSGVALARDLVLTAAHCVLPGADYKLVELDARDSNPRSWTSRIARHPAFDANAALRHRVTADVALLKLAEPVKIGAGDACAARAVRSLPATVSWSRAMASPCAATARPAARCAPRRWSQPASRAPCKSGSPIPRPRASAPASAPAPAIPARRCSAISAARSP